MSAMDDPIAAGTSEHNIILIISGDRSVLYPISLLMFRNYTVFLAVPDDDASTLSFQASKVFNWRRDVLGYPELATVSIPEAFKSPNNGWIIDGSHIPQLSLDSSSVGISSSDAISPCSEYITSPKPTTIVTPPVTTPGRSFLLNSSLRAMHGCLTIPASQRFFRWPVAWPANLDQRRYG